MRLPPEDLPAAGYRLLASLDHREIIPFVQEQLLKANWFARSYRGLVLLLLALSAGFLTFAIFRAPKAWEQILTQFSYGLALAFLLAPVHELIHGVALKAVGAPTVQYRANWRKLYLMAGADRFVANEREFYLVAFAPFVVISLGALVLSVWYPLLAIGLLFLHTAFCAGDFALAGFMNEHSEKGIVNYDLMGEGRSYFYILENQNSLV
ncbi:MAG: DUF3267 domain-containing protein [Saprospirales bacterium]|nr:DUF3267 domain-containing protein [Saprospirales bacterium]